MDAVQDNCRVKDHIDINSDALGSVSSGNDSSGDEINKVTLIRKNIAFNDEYALERSDSWDSDQYQKENPPS